MNVKRDSRLSDNNLHAITKFIMELFRVDGPKSLL